MSRYEHMGSFPPAEDDGEDDRPRAVVFILAIIGLLNLGLGLGLGYLLWS